MITHALSFSFTLSLLPLLARAQSSSTTALEPLASKHFTWPNIPYQVTGDQGGERGPQAGYNLCNSTTENQDSLCQTSFVNDITDFCLWSSGQPDDTVGESEAREFAWCTKAGHGTRIIPPGAITGVQMLYAKSYIQVVGFIDQTKVNLDASDMGGELDPHGADEQGNPLGGIEFTNGFGQSAASFDAALQAKKLGSTNYTQIIEWIDFIGSGVFCLKMCNPSLSNGPSLCAHVYDEIGCNYNALANYGAINNTFSVCDSDDMTPPGVFTDPASNQLTTWFQPFSGQFTVPYTTTIPSSSNCKTYSSNELFATASGTATTTGAGSTATGSGSGSGSTSKTGSAAGASNTNAAASMRIPSAVPIAMALAVFGMIAW